MMARQHQGGHERIQENRGHGRQLKCLKHMKTKAGQLLHGGSPDYPLT